MSLDGLYTIKRVHCDKDSNRHSVLIGLDPSHEIFKGHFPENPILPGVCIIQILKEIIVHQTGFKLFLDYADSIKFLSFLRPGINNQATLVTEVKEIDNDNIFCNAFLQSESVVFFRFKGNFKVMKG